MNYLDRNEFNFQPSEKVVEAIKNFKPETLCFYTRIYDQGKKSVISVRLSEIYHVPEEQVLLGYGGEEMLKNAIHAYKLIFPKAEGWGDVYMNIIKEVYDMCLDESSRLYMKSHPPVGGRWRSLKRRNEFTSDTEGT